MHLVNGPNQETEASTCFLPFALLLKSMDILSFEISYLTVETTQRWRKCGTAVLCKIVVC